MPAFSTRHVLRRLVPALLACCLLAPAVARAEQSANVEPIAHLPEMASAISVNFIDDTMFVSTVLGVFSYDVADPARPRLLGALPMYIWENEDVDVDRVRKRLFVSRDPRGFTTPATPGAAFPYGAVHVIDVSSPSLMRQVGFFLVPAGHTTTCVNDCDVIWTGGPLANAQLQPGFTGRPIYATDVTDPANPRPCPEPIDTGRNDGVTDYAHDVQVDAAGVAWVSGAGGVRGYWTRGEHRDPVTGETRTATGCAPVPYAGGGTPESATPSRFMHNAWRDAVGGPQPPQAAVPAASPARKPKATKRRKAHRRTVRRCRTVRRRVRGKIVRRRVCRRVIVRRPAKRGRAATVEPGLRRSDVLLATEEDVVSDCATAGRFVTYDLRGSYDGEGFRDVSRTRQRMRVLDTWTPEAQPGSSGCASSHYFTSRDDGITANAFYGQGVRFLDTTDPADVRQVGYYRVDDANAWAAYWHDGVVVVADFNRGIEILRFSGSRASRTVRAPRRSVAAPRFSRTLFGGLCPLRAAPSA